ncbi:hypothetical protein BD847_0814 [Flavobacterium cutihirudinis]|uniref:Outer membrane protein with beta-barrel domain n=1 Tax=Flavobacterium cutihirudinis TaxID=1265740 RepID=A0A3D9G0Y1_9FLAO|nr:hypothetical protein [Flavobacterium cutihirudinis]RED26888.1 hypothetical protein BD847_0814 [Flavobacterium cutihirudinis]
MNNWKINLGLILLLTCASLTTVHAQKGSLMLYGSLTYKDNNNTGSSFGANPIGVGYFFNDHVVAGMNYAFDREKNGLGDLTDSKHEIGPFYSDSWNIGDHFAIIAQADAHYVWGNTLMNTAGSYSYNGYLGRIYPIVAVFLGHGWALKAKFCELSYENTTGNDANKTSNRTFVAGINGSTFGLGVSKNISLKKSK